MNTQELSSYLGQTRDITVIADYVAIALSSGTNPFVLDAMYIGTLIPSCILIFTGCSGLQALARVFRGAEISFHQLCLHRETSLVTRPGDGKFEPQLPETHPDVVLVQQGLTSICWQESDMVL